MGAVAGRLAELADNLCHVIVDGDEMRMRTRTDPAGETCSFPLKRRQKDLVTTGLPQVGLPQEAI